MEYLNRDRLERVSDKLFQTRQPYPWVDIDGILTPEGHDLLRQNLLDSSQVHRHTSVHSSLTIHRGVSRGTNPSGRTR